MVGVAEDAISNNRVPRGSKEQISKVAHECGKSRVSPKTTSILPERCTNWEDLLLDQAASTDWKKEQTEKER